MQYLQALEFGDHSAAAVQYILAYQQASGLPSEDAWRPTESSTSPLRPSSPQNFRESTAARLPASAASSQQLRPIASSPSLLQTLAFSGLWSPVSQKAHTDALRAEEAARASEAAASSSANTSMMSTANTSMMSTALPSTPTRSPRPGSSSGKESPRRVRVSRRRPNTRSGSPSPRRLPMTVSIAVRSLTPAKPVGSMYGPLRRVQSLPISSGAGQLPRTDSSPEAVAASHSCLFAADRPSSNLSERRLDMGHFGADSRAAKAGRSEYRRGELAQAASALAAARREGPGARPVAVKQRETAKRSVLPQINKIAPEAAARRAPTPEMVQEAVEWIRTVPAHEQADAMKKVRDWVAAMGLDWTLWCQECDRIQQQKQQQRR
eukprot:gnl/TRDRNA2_/TRDRNA2_85431_c0_seq1.p1 gnl/TRDRNA2_/TRDRNA2_85431_c0~~gnl/TRDRNA2_/TRDRNA2_85431_c0_seq1.p1  ORF type:complete len:379 (+),score=43.94 gnl/TRDRNA2_/TRDRNA2_85431_c0_seq1:126-1262(+)